MEDDERRLAARFREQAEACYAKGRYLFTGFLGLAETDLFLRAARDFSYLPYAMWGGAEGCERVMARYGDEETLGYPPDDFPIACLKIAPLSPKFAEPLSHRDYLGACLNLGIGRECLGDILRDGTDAYLFCEEKMADFITEQLTRVKHTAVRVTRAVPPEGLGRATETVTVQLTSPRMDALIAHVYGLARSEAAALFAEGRVFVNGRACPAPDTDCRPDDVVSTRGYGKMIYRGVTGKTKKGKDNVTVEKYV